MKTKHPFFRIRSVDYRIRSVDGRHFEPRYRRSIDGAVKEARRRAVQHGTVVAVDYREELANGTPCDWQQIGVVHPQDPDTWHRAPTSDQDSR